MEGLLEHFLRDLPTPMQKPLLRHWQRYQDAANAAHISIPQTAEFLQALWRILAVSDYVSHIFCHQVQYPIEFFQAPPQKYQHQDFLNEWSLFSSNIQDEDTLMRALRMFRHKAITRIIWRELLNLCSFTEHLQELSALADVCVQVATEFIYQQSCLQWGTPCNESGQAQPFIVIAVGKLGGNELNLSSDIDLIFTYPEEGVTSTCGRSISNEQFFTKVAQTFIKVLANVTEDGFVYRVDVRLRPHGQSGKLVLNFSAIENYYQYQGREWERYALIKARIVTGTEYAQQLLSLLHPFVYRRYLDYGAFESLREMKELVSGEVKRRRIQKDIKLGPGGIRQIEFLVQAFQLIRGGQHPQFQHRELLVVLSRLAQSGYLEKKVCKDLEKSYIFLRRLEHRIQMIHDNQTHIIPKSPLDRARVTITMGYPGWEAFQIALKGHIASVSGYFDSISSTPQHNKAAQINTQYDKALVWSCIEESETKNILLQMGYQNPEAIQASLLQFKNSRLCQGLKKHASARLDKIMPVLIVMIAKSQNQIHLLERMLRMMQAIVRRSAYLSLLLEKRQALSYLINIAEQSEWVLQQLCAYPVLLDELLSPPQWPNGLDILTLEKELSERLSWLSPNDLEGQMDNLRQFKLTWFLHVATDEIFHTQANGDIAKTLCDITEVILAKVYEISLDFMIRHYHLKEDIKTLQEKIPFGIIAYGKLGAREINYASDLDLVFLFDAQNNQTIESQDKAISNDEFSLRLAQRIIHILSTHTASGTLFEVDVRLRPLGSAGLLVSPIQAFGKYLREQAWTFEHQALVKARFILGPTVLNDSFDILRQDILSSFREPHHLQNEILLMREKMLGHHVSKSHDIKVIKGGLADIEFIAQYYILRFAKEFPVLLNERAVLSILEQLLSLRLMTEIDVNLLKHAFVHYQMLIRRKILQPAFHLSEDSLLDLHLQAVHQIFQKTFSSSLL